jgi:hypothetical protein
VEAVEREVTADAEKTVREAAAARTVDEAIE